MAEIVLASFLRIVTNGKIFDPPTPMDTAIAFLSASRRLAARGSARAKPPTLGSLPLVADAYLAALAIEHGGPTATSHASKDCDGGIRSVHKCLRGCET